MRALSICQPWAWAIVHGYKTVENRTWRPDYAGPLVIHASRSGRYLARPDLWEHLLPSLPPPADLPRGALVGVVTMTGCWPLEAVAADDPFATGPWCFLLADARPLAAARPWRGQLGFFDVPDRVIRPRTRTSTS
jgi:hypothetical protein